MKLSNQPPFAYPFISEELAKPDYKKILNSLKDAVCILNETGHYIYISEVGEAIFGYTPDEMIGKKYTAFVAEKDIERTEAAFESAKKATPSPNFLNHYIRKDGRTIPVLWSGHWVAEENLHYCIAQDVTQKIKDQKQQRKLYKDISSTLEQINEGFIIVDKNWHITFSNHQAENLLNLPPDSLQSTLLWNHFPKTFDEVYFSNFQRAMLQQKQVFFEAIHPNEYFVLEFNVYPTSSGLSIIFRDITERVSNQQMNDIEQEEQRKKLTAALLQQQEKERSMFGRELHDNVNQVLTTVKLYNEICLTSEYTNKELLKKSTQMLLNTINEIREISKKLSAPTLGDIELCESVKELVHNIMATNPITIILDMPDMEGADISKDLHIGVYRIIQEQLENILLHAEAETIQLTLRKTNRTLSLMIADDGKGFNMATHNKGVGINNMIGRADSLNGSLRLIGLPGSGCTLVASFPYRFVD